MKLIEALKKEKDLKRKADDLRHLVKDHCAISSLESEKYPDQKTKVKSWMQSHFDILQEILELRLSIQKTNLETPVTMSLNGKDVTKSIAGWIHRRRDLAKEDLLMWQQLSDRGIREGKTTGPAGDEIVIQIRRFYDPAERDKMVDAYASEESIINARLEVVNAVTDLIE